MRWKKQKASLLYLLVAVILLIVAFVGFRYYSQSKVLKKQADALVQLNQPAQAIVFYKKAQSVFPFRWDLKDDIAGTQLIMQSRQDLDSITDFSEIQIPPPLANLPSKQLAPNEIFVPVLMYHHIEVNPKPYDTIYAALYVAPTQLDEQLAYFSSHHYHTMTLDELSDVLDGKTPLPKNPIILTFDDGYQSFYDHAYPLLKKYHMKAVQFVITQVEEAPAYLSWNEIVEMDKSGLVEIGAHTRHHPNLPDLSEIAILDEITGSKSDIEQHLHHPIHWFAYPYGSYSPFIIQTVKSAGFMGAASTIYGTNQSKDNLYLFPRIMIDGRYSLSNIAMRIAP